MQHDKLLHLLVGAVVAALAFPLGPIWAVLTVIFAGIIKEVQDAYGDGTPDIMDTLATVAGGFLMAGWLWMFI